ncbi:hypothetical protein NECAME_12204 [Necator americanus]|uniref:Uncharacterized protein n=1 Tax=Necator americanus TaxID=51031 RepID=W2T191_NECAM|nr:hypothetical protein NECAME_12204 [Necator americanus]ETN75678.1 hypothetical protein NECAME_12204 [Necator americanus]
MHQQHTPAHNVELGMARLIAHLTFVGLLISSTVFAELVKEDGSALKLSRAKRQCCSSSSSSCCPQQCASSSANPLAKPSNAHRVVPQAAINSVVEASSRILANLANNPAPTLVPHQFVRVHVRPAVPQHVEVNHHLKALTRPQRLIVAELRIVLHSKAEIPQRERAYRGNMIHQRSTDCRFLLKTNVVLASRLAKPPAAAPTAIANSLAHQLVEATTTIRSFSSSPVRIAVTTNAISSVAHPAPLLPVPRHANRRVLLLALQRNNVLQLVCRPANRPAHSNNRNQSLSSYLKAIVAPTRVNHSAVLPVRLRFASSPVTINVRRHAVRVRAAPATISNRYCNI